MLRTGALVLGFGVVGCAGQTSPATNITSTSVTLNGTVSCNAGDYGTWWWEYKALDASSWIATTPHSYSCSFNAGASVKKDISGLSADTHYLYHLVTDYQNRGTALYADSRGYLTTDQNDPAAAWSSFDTLASPPSSVPWGFFDQWRTYTDPAGATHTPTEQVNLAAAIGSDSARMGIPWASIESVKTDPQQLQSLSSWKTYDAIYNAMQAKGIRPIIVVSNAPAWARDPAAYCPYSGTPCSYPPAAAYDQRWKDFVAAVLVRYPQARALEVWNEENLARFWAPEPQPGRYETVLALAHQAKLETGSTVPVIIGGLSHPSTTTAAAWRADDFLDAIYQQPGGAGAFDGIGDHPYPMTSPWADHMWAAIDRIRAVRDRYGDGDKPIWITEVGISTDPNSSASVSLDQQGPVLANFYTSIATHESLRPGYHIAALTIYRFREDVGGTGDSGGYWGQFGVVTNRLVPKPAYCYLGSALGKPCA